MGFFGALSALLDEDSDNSFENKMNGMLDKVEGALQTSLDKAENGIKKMNETAEKTMDTINKADRMSKAAEQQIKKLDNIS